MFIFSLLACAIVGDGGIQASRDIYPVVTVGYAIVPTNTPSGVPGDCCSNYSAAHGPTASARLAFAATDHLSLQAGLSVMSLGAQGTQWVPADNGVEWRYLDVRNTWMRTQWALSARVTYTAHGTLQWIGGAEVIFPHSTALERTIETPMGWIPNHTAEPVRGTPRPELRAGLGAAYALSVPSLNLTLSPEAQLMASLRPGAVAPVLWLGFSISPARTLPAAVRQEDHSEISPREPVRVIGADSSTAPRTLREDLPNSSQQEEHKQTRARIAVSVGEYRVEQLRSAIATAVQMVRRGGRCSALSVAIGLEGEHLELCRRLFREVAGEAVEFLPSLHPSDTCGIEVLPE